MPKTVTPITDAERAARQDIVDQTLATLRLEDLEPSDETKAIAKRYVDGELTIWEMGEEIRAANARSCGPVHISGH